MSKPIIPISREAVGGITGEFSGITKGDQVGIITPEHNAPSYPVGWEPSK